MMTLADVRRKIREMMLNHEQSPPNEQQVRACLQELLFDLADVEANDGEEAETKAVGRFTSEQKLDIARWIVDNQHLTIRQMASLMSLNYHEVYVLIQTHIDVRKSYVLKEDYREPS